MSLGDRERVHTALLAWLLGEHSPLEPRRRGQLAAALAGEPAWEVARTQSWTEVKRLDVLVELESAAETRLLAIEAKLKSREHSDQLARYDLDLAARGHRCAKVFLTLVGDSPDSGTGWRPVSYTELVAAVRSVNSGAAGENPYVVDYVAMLERLVLAARVAVSPAGARVVFEKESKDDALEHPGFGAYVRELRLHKLLQQVWMSELRDAVLRDGALTLPPGWQTEIDETNGAALLNFQTTALHPGYCVGLQVQNRSCKMFCYPVTPDAHPTAEQIQCAAVVLEQARARAGVAAKPSATRTQGFTSVTLCKLAGTDRDLATWTAAVSRALRTTMGAMAAAHAPPRSELTSQG